MYTTAGFGGMIADDVRMAAYEQALRRTVRPGSVVVDIGTGTGIFSLLACQFGARKVYAIEPDPAIEVAREIAAANGYLDRIVFIQGLSTRITLPERADVIVSDIRGVLPLFQHHIPTIVHARQRLLTPGGVLIPQRDTVLAAVVDAPELYARHMTPWAQRPFGLDMQAAQRIVSNTWLKRRVTPDQLLLEPKSWAVLDYSTVENPNVSEVLSWTATRSGIGHGLTVWFDAMLADNVGFSNAPAAPELIYGAAFFPWTQPVTIDPGDSVTVALRADLVGEDYIWRWDTTVLDAGRPGQVKAKFNQSTFFGVPVSPAHLRKRAESYVPVLDDEGRIDQFILAAMDGETPLGKIARRVCDRFPSRFAEAPDALNRVSDLAQRYSR
jgi:protein arginine N-methyltransferase 1